MEYLKIVKMHGDYGKLLPPDLADSYFKVQFIEQNTFAFVGSKQIEARKLNIERMDNHLQF